MIRRLRGLLLIVLALTLRIAPAHHSPAIYDTAHEIIVRATVVSFDWVRPHTWTTIHVTATDGSASTWRLEGMNPDYLGARSWDRSTLKPGDEIDVAFYPRRDGELVGMFIRATLPDGTLKVMAITER